MSLSIWSFHFIVEEKTKAWPRQCKSAAETQHRSETVPVVAPPWAGIPPEATAVNTMMKLSAELLTVFEQAASLTDRQASPEDPLVRRWLAPEDDWRSLGRSDVTDSLSDINFDTRTSIFANFLSTVN